MMKQGLYILSVLIVLSACKKQKLDGLAFPSQELDNYELANYEDPELALPDSMVNAPIEQTLVSFESVSEETGESYTLYGLYLGDTATIDTDTVIYFCHGQARHMDFYWTRAALLAHLGSLHNYGVFMIDYRGYGMSEGISSEVGLTEDADAGLNWLIDKGLTDDRCVYYGFSLGAIPMIERAANRTDFQPQKLICESPLASVAYLTQSSTLINVDSDFVTSLEFNNAEMIRSVDVPFFWIHGTDDSYIDIQNGELIYTNYQGPYKQALRVEGGDHGNVPEVYGLNEYLDQWLQFIHL